MFLSCCHLIFSKTALLLTVTGIVSNIALAQLPPPADSGENQFSVNQTMFSTLAAINAAGYDAGIDSALNTRFRVRTQIREELQKRKIQSLPELRAFYKEHLKPDATANLSQYVSFALAVNGPPNFESISPEMPPDAQALKGFSEILARFYKEANLEDLWTRSQPAYAAAIAEYQDPVINTLFEANGYLRNPSGNPGRRFQIYLDLLAAPNQIQVRNYKSDYFIVITPSSTPVVEEIRDAYLSYLLDPLTFKFSKVIESKKALQTFADEAPALDLAYKDSFALLVNKSLIKAIDSRLMHSPPEARQQAINNSMRGGFILTAALAELLPVYEKQQDSMRLYYPDLIGAIDVKKERKRLSSIQFVQSATPRIVAPPAAMQIAPVEAALEAAEGLYEQNDLENSQKTFKRIFEQTTDKQFQGRAYYGLARIAVKLRHFDEAVDLFQRTVEANPNAAITAWAHVYLGRLAFASHNADRANLEFKTALAVEGASAQAQQAAQKGLESTSSTGTQPQ